MILGEGEHRYDGVASMLPTTPEAETVAVPAEPADAVSPPGGGGEEPSVREQPRRATGHHKRSFMDRIDAYVSRLSTRNNFFHRLASLIWLPYAFHSGIRMKRLDRKTFTAVLPFRRFNRNWYNAMAGAALLGNAEVAGGMYVFGVVGGDFTVVCKNLEYRFLRPCLGPAVYRINPREDIETLAAKREEFDVTVDMDVVQSITKPGGKERRVGKATATFHVTPKLHQKSKGRRIR